MEKLIVFENNFKYLDGTKIELQQDRSESPLLIFYPSGEISGGEIDYTMKTIFVMSGN